MTVPASPFVLTWGWSLLCLAALGCQTLMMLVAAPFFTGWVDRLGGRMAGECRYRVSGRWQEIRHQFTRPGLAEPDQKAGAGVVRAGFVLAVLGCSMVPVFMLLPAGFPAPGLLLISAVLILASLLLSLPLVAQPGRYALNGYMVLIADALLLPALIPVLVMVGGQDLAAFLTQIRSLSPLGNGAPFVLMGVAVFAVAWRSQQGDEEGACPLSGPDRGLWLLARDCVRLCWVTLAGDIAWSGMLSLPTTAGMEAWSIGCLEGTGVWVVKVAIAAVLLALTYLMVLPLPKQGRVRLATVFLLGLLAWQVAYPVLTPQQEPSSTTAAAALQNPIYGDDGGMQP